MSQDMRESFAETLAAMGRSHPELVVLDADLNTSTGAHRFAREFPERFVQCGIAEQNMIGIAAGIATTHRLVPLAVTFGVFASRRVYDQVSISVAYPRLNVKIIGASSGLTSAPGGASHQSLEDLALMRAMPNMTVIDPADNAELASALESMVGVYDGPVYIRTMRCAPPPITPRGYRFERGRAIVLRQGSDVSLVGAGLLTSMALRAADMLAAGGISARVIHSPCVKPLDEDTIVRAAQETGAIVTAENHSIIGGLGGAVAELVSLKLPVPVVRVGTRDVFGESGPMESLFAKYGLTAERIVEAAHAAVAAKEECVRFWRRR